MDYLLSIYSDEKSLGAVVWRCIDAYKLADQVIDLPENCLYPPPKAKPITVTEVVKDIGPLAIQDAVDEYDFRSIIANQVGASRPSLYGVSTTYRPMPSAAEVSSLYAQMTQGQTLRMGAGTTALLERIQQGHDHPSVKAFGVGLAYLRLTMAPAFTYGVCRW